MGHILWFCRQKDFIVLCSEMKSFLSVSDLCSLMSFVSAWIITEAEWPVFTDRTTCAISDRLPRGNSVLQNHCIVYGQSLCPEFIQWSVQWRQSCLTLMTVRMTKIQGEWWLQTSLWYKLGLVLEGISHSPFPSAAVCECTCENCSAWHEAQRCWWA